MEIRDGHPGEDEIQEGIDGRLPSSRHAEIQAHLGRCDDCRRRWEALAWLKEQVSSASPPAPPPSLTDGIIRALDNEDRRRATRTEKRWRSARSVFMASAAIAAVVIVALFVQRPRDLPAAVARDHEALKRGRLPFAMQTADVGKMEAFFAQAGLSFRVRVFDLGMMGYQLVGGSVSRVEGRPSALFVYRGDKGELLLCQMYEGALGALPAGSRLREHDGIPFRVYERGDVTLVFWPEGGVICVLAGEGGPEAIVPLAFAKATKAARERRL